MVAYSIKQEVFTVKEYHRSWNSIVSAQRRYWQHFGVCDGPTNWTVLRWVDKFDRTGSVSDESEGHAGWLSLRMPDSVDEAWEIFLKSPRKRLHKVSQQMRMSYTTVRKIYWSDLFAYRYKMQLSQLLTPNVKEWHVQFAMEFSALFQKGPNIIKKSIAFWQSACSFRWVHE